MLLRQILKQSSKRSTELSRGLATVTGIRGRQIIDSRGHPTVEADVITQDGKFTASVPSGASTGIYEAVELRDGGKAFMGKGVKKAVASIEGAIAKAVTGMDPTQQAKIDDTLRQLDGTDNKSKLGANAILGVSLAISKAGAAANKIPLYKHYGDLAGNTSFVLPVPSFNVINGGKHAGNKLAFQEFMILPVGASTFSESMAMGCEVYQHLAKVIKAKYGQDAVNVGDEGGFAPSIQSNEEGVELLMAAIEKAGYLDQVKIGMDVASSEFLKDGKYDLDFKNPGGKLQLSGPEFIKMYKDLISKYPIVSIEDPFDQDDWDNYAKFTAEAGRKVQIVGDDLLVTNVKRIKDAAAKKACNALLLKVNQIGTVTESIDAVKLAKQSGWGVMTSHRSGETEDHYIADLAVGLCTGQIKTGAPCRSERLAKYNQLLRIEEDLGSQAKYAGHTFRTPAWMA